MNSTTYNIPKTVFLVGLPLASLVGVPLYVYYNGVVWQEPVMLLIGWFFAGLGITVGYHRLFAHRSFKAKPITEWFIMLISTAALQNKIVNWCSDHRRHHRMLDTKDDPYSITEGFFHAHIGWIMKKTPTIIEGVEDLKKKSCVKFQSKFYWPLAISMCFILPVVIGSFYGRPLGGFLWGGILRVTLVHHFTYFINSLCHYAGTRPYDVNTTARDSWYMALFTFGEGYHNFHHKFQWDYRNGIRWYDFDPSKWFIKILSYFRLTYDLKKVQESRILKARFDCLSEQVAGILNECSSVNYKKYLTTLDEANAKVKSYMKSWRELEREASKINVLESIPEKISQINSLRHQYKVKMQGAINSLSVILISLKDSLA
jgi:stearoyl-CoA desaturase (delta-9 desaturase)